MPSRSSRSAEIRIAVPPEAVWRALTQPTGVRRWMNRTDVRSSWVVGAPIEIDVLLEGEVRHDRGTVEVVDEPRLLRYSLWSAVSRRPDTPENRSRVTFELSPEGEGTRLSVLHDGLIGAAGPHVAFFWPVALSVLRDGLEERLPRSSIQLI
jgi:uncharacterized protein YndB with AHSA1/START domain